MLRAPSTRPLYYGGVALEASDKGSRLVAYSADGKPAGLTPYRGPQWSSGRPLRLTLQRDGYRITGSSGGIQLGPVAITDPTQRKLLDEPQRFKLSGWQGSLYSVRDAVLTDGPEAK